MRRRKVRLIGYNSVVTRFPVESKSSTLLWLWGANVPGNESTRERKFHVTFALGSESSWERKFQGTKVPENESSRERMFQGAKVPGSEGPTYGTFVLGTDSRRGNESSIIRYAVQKTGPRLTVSPHSHPLHHRVSTKPRSHRILPPWIEPSWLAKPSNVVCTRECMESQ